MPNVINNVNTDENQSNFFKIFKIILIIFLLKECIHDIETIYHLIKNSSSSFFSEFGAAVSSLFNFSAAAVLLKHRFEMMTDDHHAGVFLLVLRLASLPTVIFMLWFGISKGSFLLVFPLAYIAHFITWRTNIRWLKIASGLALGINAAIAIWVLQIILH